MLQLLTSLGISSATLHPEASTESAIKSAVVTGTTARCPVPGYASRAGVPAFRQLRAGIVGPQCELRGVPRVSTGVPWFCGKMVTVLGGWTCLPNEQLPADIQPGSPLTASPSGSLVWATATYHARGSAGAGREVEPGVSVRSWRAARASAFASGSGLFLLWNLGQGQQLRLLPWHRGHGSGPRGCTMCAPGPGALSQARLPKPAKAFPFPRVPRSAACLPAPRALLRGLRLSGPFWSVCWAWALGGAPAPQSSPHSSPAPSRGPS